MKNECKIFKFSNRAAYSILGSILLHLFALLLLTSLNNIISLATKSDRIEITSIDRTELNRLRQLGKHDSKNQNMSVRLNGTPTAQRSTKLDLSSLQIGSNEKFDEKKSSQTNKPKVKNLLPTKALDALSLNGDEVKEFLKSNPNSGVIGLNINTPIFNKSDFSIKMELPKGVDINELNPEELIFYGFQRRALQSFISSFYQSLNKFKIKNPHIDLSQESDQTKMTGRVLFDKNGNVRGIKIIRYSNQNRVQEFFINILETLSLPNPPKSLLNQDEQFAYYFSLILKG